jgi:uncharacterized protein (DUF1778 family)
VFGTQNIAGEKVIKTRSIPIRFSDAELLLINEAAHLIGENRSEFIRNAAKEKARKIIRLKRKEKEDEQQTAVVLRL